MYLGVIVAQKFLSINGSILLAKHSPFINAHLERSKQRNALYVSPHVEIEIINRT